MDRELRNIYIRPAAPNSYRTESLSNVTISPLTHPVACAMFCLARKRLQRKLHLPQSFQFRGNAWLYRRTYEK